MPNPTIVSASLDDKELQASINQMVANFDGGLQKMLDHSNEYVGKIQESLEKIGKTNFGATDSNDGGTSKQVKAQEEFAESVDKTTSKIKKQGEASEMTFDQIAAGLDKARRTVSEFNTSRASGVLPSSEDYKRYEQSLARIVEYNDKLKSSAMAMATANEKWFGGFNAKRINEMFFPKDDGKLAAMSKYYADLEQQSQKAAQSAQRYTEEIRKQAEEIRKSQQWKEKGYVTVNGRDIYNLESANVKTSQRKTLEEQLLYYQQLEGMVIKNNTQEESRQVAQSQQQLEVEKQITQEQAKRKKYVAPEAQIGYDVTRGKLADIISQKTGDTALGWNEQTSSLRRLNAALKQYQDTYSKMSSVERNSPFGAQVVSDMRVLERSINRIRQQMSRPVNLDSIINMPAKTLDDIAYKMRQLSAYRSGLDVDKQKDEIGQVNKAYTELQKKMNEVIQKNTSLVGSNNVLANSWRYMRNRLAFYFTVGVATSFARSLAQVRSEYEMNEKALGVLLNSAERGTRIFNELSNMALVSPYTLIELSAAAKQLTAYDVAAKDVVDTTRRLADISAAVGIPVERLTYALGQVKAYGHLTSQDARQFLNAGVPLVKELANRYTELEGKLISTADVYDRMKKHAISYNDVLAVLTSMTDEGGRFFDYQAKMAETLKVRIANLTLAYNNMLNDIGKAEGGVFNGLLKGATLAFKHWRDLYRIIATTITTVGLYRTATMLAGITTKSAIGASAAAWLSIAASIRSAKDAVTFFSMAVKSVPFAGWVAAITSVLSYFVFFNNAGDEAKQKLEEIASAFEGVRKEVTNLFADATSTDNIGTQLSKLKDILELAETELGITIPIRLEDVNESNIKKKLNEAKRSIEGYLNFSQTFSEKAVDSNFNEGLNKYGKEARSIYTSITESVNSVRVALQELIETGQASQFEIDALNELTTQPKEGESRVEHLQRLVSLYEDLGLIGKKVVKPMIEENFFKSYFKSTTDNMDELANEQEESLNRLGITNKNVFENMLEDAQKYYSSSSFAAEQVEKQIKRVAETINLDNMSEEERTLKLEVAINQEAAKNNWNTFEIEFAKQIANKKFGTKIVISEDSKRDAEADLKQWQKDLQAEADRNKIKLTVSFTAEQTEAGYAASALNEYKSALEDVATLERKQAAGTASAYAVQKAKEAAQNAKEAARLAGADLASLDKKNKGSGSISKKDILGDALAKEVQLIGEIQKRYKEYQQMGVNAQEAVTLATEEYGHTLRRTNATLAKYGIATKSSDELAGMDIREVRDYYKALLEGAKNKDNAKGIEAIEKALAGINVEITKLDYKKITDGLNNELGKLKEEYELAVELDADPEMGNLFAEMWGINMENLPHTAKEYADRYTKELNKYLKEKGSNLELPNLLNLTKDDMRAFQEQRDNKVLNEEWYNQIEKGYKATHDARDKEIKDSINGYEKLLEKYSEYEYKMLQIERTANNERKAFAMKFGNDSQKSEVIGLITDIDIEKDPQKKEQLKEQLKKVLTEIAGSDAAKLQLTVAIDNRELQEGAKLAFEEFKKTPDWIVATGDLAGLTDKALRGLINRVEDYKKKAKNLDPKQIKEINRALKALHKQVREGNPFAAIIDVIEQADERAKEYQPELDGIMSDIISLEKEIGDNDPTEEQAEHLKTLKDKWLEVKKTQEDTGKVDVKQLTSSINDSIQAASQATKVFTDMMDAIAGEGNNASQTIKDITSVLEKGGQGAAIGAQIGGGYGAIIGAAAGVVTGLVSIFAGAGNRRITEAVEESERAVKRLENRVESLKGTYDAMTDSAEHSYGAQSAAATLAASSIKEQEVALKRLMLSETKRQLRLEQSRDSKDRDDDKILSLQKDIISQQNEIDSMLRETNRAVDEVVDSLLGISRGSWAEELTDAMITAFKAGEDYMDVFEDSWEEMVQNMVVKTIAARVIGDALEKHVLSKIEEIENKETSHYRQQQAEIAQHKANLQNLRLENEKEWLAQVSQLPEFAQAFETLGEDAKKAFFDPMNSINAMWGKRTPFLEKYGDQLEQALFKVYDKYVTGIEGDLNVVQQTAQIRALQEVMTEDTKNKMMEDLGQVFPQIMETWGVKFGQDADKELSALQRGIQGVSEQTAGAIESYMNGVSQQVYLQSNVLQQINIAVQSFNFDAQLGTISQILLQLQTTYQNQQAIRSIMEGWTNASGMAVRVEMV